jgi:hypothetical protein
MSERVNNWITRAAGGAPVHFVVSNLNNSISSFCHEIFLFKKAGKYKGGKGIVRVVQCMSPKLPGLSTPPSISAATESATEPVTEPTSV